MIDTVIFDLDGVLTSTDEFHYQAWKKMADDEGIYFDREINLRLRGVSRLQSLEIILEKADKKYTKEEIEYFSICTDIISKINNENLVYDKELTVEEFVQLFSGRNLTILHNFLFHNTGNKTLVEEDYIEKVFKKIHTGE